MSGAFFVTAKAALVLACALGGRAPACGAAEDVPPNEGAAARDTSFPHELPLASGLTVLVGQEDHAAFLEAVLVVRAGSAGEASPVASAASILAEGFLAGRLGGDGATVRQRLAREGATVDHTVGRDVAVFRFAVPTRRGGPFLRLLATLLGRERIGPDAWREAVVRDEAAAASRQVDAWQESVRALERLVWHESTREARAAAQDGEAEALEPLWRASYVPERMVLGLWSPLDTDELAELVRAELGGLSRRAAGSPLAPSAEPTLLAPRGGIRCLQAPGATPPVLLMGAGAELRDERSFYAWQLLAHVLGASHASRLHNRLRGEEQLLYTVEASCTPVGSRGLLLRIAAQTDELLRVRAIVLEELERLRTEELAPRDVAIGKAILRSRLWLDEDSLQQRFYRRALARLLPGREREDERGSEALEALDPAALREVARRTLEPASLATLVVSARAEAVCDGSSVTAGGPPVALGGRP